MGYLHTYFWVSLTQFWVRNPKNPLTCTLEQIYCFFFSFSLRNPLPNSAIYKAGETSAVCRQRMG